MKKIILSELLLIFLATTFQTDTQDWYQQILPRSDVTVQDIFFLDSLKGWAVSNKTSNDSSFIFFTTNGGSNWLTQFGNNQLLVALCLTDPLNGYSVGGTVGGTGKIFKTSNGGLNWNLILTAGHGFTDVFFVNSDTGWACDDDGFVGAGLLKTTNGGTNWTQQLTASSEPSKLFFISKDTGWVICQSTKLLRTINGGTNWDQISLFPQNLVAIFFINKDTGYVSGGGGSSSIKITTDGGFNWVSSNNSTGGNDIFFINGSIGFDCDIFSTVEKTFDGGYNWFAQTVPTGYYYSIRFTDTLRGWSGGTKLIHTTDGGGPPVGINPISNNVPKDFTLSQNYPNPFNPSTVINYELRVTSYINIRVFDITGKFIVDLVNRKQNAGEYQVQFEGSELSSGVYFYSLFVNDKLIETKRMVLLK